MKQGTFNRNIAKKKREREKPLYASRSLVEHMPSMHEPEVQYPVLGKKKKKGL